MNKKILNKKFQIFKQIKNIINFLNKLTKNILQIGERHRRFFEICQLSVIYFLAMFQLLLTCLQMSASVPEFYKSLPFFEKLAYSSLGSFFSNPDKVYIFYLLAQELVILRPHIFRFSLIVRYHILYLMTLEFIFYWIITWWDILCNIEEDLIFKPKIDKAAASDFFLFLFIIYLLLYVYSYIQAIRRRIPDFPTPILQKIPDSVAFFLQIKREEPKKKKS